MDNRVTQQDEVLQYIRDNGSITSRDAAFDLDIMDLPKVICLLQNKGQLIKHTRETHRNKNGKVKKFMRYSFFTEEELMGRKTL